MQRDTISKSVESLQKGEVIVYPTDTLYALGADIYNEKAVEKVFNIKKRPRDNPLPVAVSCFKDINKIAYVTDNARVLTDVFLPGALTIILNKKNVVPSIVTGGRTKIAIRIPDNKIALELLSAFGPLTATSANIHGMNTPFLIEDIKTHLNNNEIKIYVDQGRLSGLASTIVDLTFDKPKILREGVIKEKDILSRI